MLSAVQSWTWEGHGVEAYISLIHFNSLIGIT